MKYEDAIREQRLAINALTDQFEHVRDELAAEQRTYRDTVVDALHDLQSTLEEPVTLLHIQEYGRIHASYEEVLTPDGVETRGNGYHDWTGAKPIEDYLNMIYRGTMEHIDKLGDRLIDLDGTPPEIGYPVNG